MNVLDGIKRGFLENPIVGRQLSTQLTRRRLGVVMTFVAGSLLAVGVITFSAMLLGSSRDFKAGFAGSFLHFVNWEVIYALLAFLLPLRVAGVIDGPRGDKAFDQLVVTGISPLRLHFGNWALAFAYALFLLLVTLPFQAYACMLGGKSWSTVALGYTILALYSNVIILVTMGFGIMEREWAAVPAAIGFFWLAALLAHFPVPGVIGLIAPHRLMEHVGATPFVNPAVARYVGDPVLFLTPISAWVYAPLLWCILLAPLAVVLLLGPAHRFTPGLNNFGNVVLPGDRGRRMLRRLRAALTRKVELAFFYENRPRWLEGLEYPLRVGVLVLLVVFAWGITVGLVFAGAPAVHPRREFWSDEHFGASIGITAGVLFIAVLFLAETRRTRLQRERVGRWTVPRGLAGSLCALVLIASFLLLHERVLHAAVQVSPGPTPTVRTKSLEEYVLNCRQWVGTLALFLLNCHLLTKALGGISAFAAPSRGLTLLAALAVFLGPFLVAAGIGERWLPADLAPLLFATPLSLSGFFQQELRDVLPRGFFGPGKDFARHMTWQLGFLAAMVAVLALIAAISRRRRGGRSLAAVAAKGIAGALLCLPLFAGGRTGFLPAQEAAAPLPLETELTRGFDGEVFHPTEFFTLTLRNRTDRVIRGTFYLEIDGKPVSRPREFEAPPRTALPIRWVEEGMDALQLLYAPMRRAKLVLVGPDGRLEVDVPPLSSASLSHAMNPGGDEAPQHLLITDDVSVSSAPREHVKARWVAVKSHALPEDLRPYSGIDAVLVARADLSRWSAGQRRALYDYLRLGGVVVFCGRKEDVLVQGAGEWEVLIKMLEVEPAPGGDDAAGKGWEVLLRAADGSPALTSCALGPGRLCRLAPDPADLFTQVSPFGSSSFWTDFNNALAGSAFPPRAVDRMAIDLELRDSTSLFAVLGYFSLYVIAIGPVTFALLGRKRRRRLLLLAAVPVLFTALLPVLHASLHLRPSRGALHQVAVFGPGATRGTALASLLVRSSGRESHSVQVQGLNVRAFSAAMPRFAAPDADDDAPRLLAPLELVPAAGKDEAAWGLSLSLSPWGLAEVFIAGDVTLAEPIRGRALLHSNRTKLFVRASGLPPVWTQEESHLLARPLGQTSFSSTPLTSADVKGRALSLEVSVSGDPAGAGDLTLRRRGFEGTRLGLPLPARGERVYLLFSVPEIGLDVTSRHLVFEREVGEVEELQPARKAAASTKTSRLLEGYSSRDGKLFRSLRRTMILQELPLEVR